MKPAHNPPIPHSGQLSAEPFSRWLRDRIERYRQAGEHNPEQRVADEVGRSPRWVWRHANQLDVYDQPTDTYDASMVEDHLWKAGVFLWEVYPEVETSPLDQPDQPDQPRGGKPPGVYGKLTSRDLELLFRLHDRGGISIRELGRQVWHRYGYANARSAANSISDGFKRMGFKARDRVEATRKASTKHGLAPRDRASWNARQKAHRRRMRVKRGEIQGKRCAGVKLTYPQKGRPCQRPAAKGSDFCKEHDPVLRAEVLERAARARASQAKA